MNILCLQLIIGAIILEAKHRKNGGIVMDKPNSRPKADPEGNLNRRPVKKPVVEEMQPEKPEFDEIKNEHFDPNDPWNWHHSSDDERPHPLPPPSEPSKPKPKPRSETESEEKPKPKPKEPEKETSRFTTTKGGKDRNKSRETIVESKIVTMWPTILRPNMKGEATYCINPLFTTTIGLVLAVIVLLFV